MNKQTLQTKPVFFRAEIKFSFSFSVFHHHSLFLLSAWQSGWYGGRCTDLIIQTPGSLSSFATAARSPVQNTSLLYHICHISSLFSSRRGCHTYQCPQTCSLSLMQKVKKVFICLSLLQTICARKPCCLKGSVLLCSCDRVCGHMFLPGLINHQNNSTTNSSEGYAGSFISINIYTHIYVHTENIKPSLLVKHSSSF